MDCYEKSLRAILSNNPDLIELIFDDKNKSVATGDQLQNIIGPLSSNQQRLCKIAAATYTNSPGIADLNDLLELDPGLIHQTIQGILIAKGLLRIK